ncbi:MAG: protein translocase subunit SecD [Patescibacteria group bacterium]|nr:protein translocase subunit SecD [Patescibacteria group bacterium]
MKKTISRLVVILLILVFATYIALPQEYFFNVNVPYFSYQFQFKKPQLDINLFGFNLNERQNLKLGLDLAGGSHMVFEADTSGIDQSRKQLALDGLKSIIEKRVNLFGISEPEVRLSTFEGKDRIIVELPGVKDTKEANSLIGSTAQLVFAELGSEDNPGLIPTDLTGADLESSDVIYDQTTGKPVIAINFTKEGEEKFAEITARNVGKVLPILIDGMPISAPLVQEKITGGKAIISGDFSLNDAKSLSIQLNAGALPVPVTLVEQRVVGAALGSDSIQKSINAGIIGICMVAIFMLLIYKNLGFVALFALFSFSVITICLYKLVPIVLTLPGIAGFLLSVGMAVDSNILIFERFKEEKRRRLLADALEVSFGKAWDSIRDANIATLVTAFVLANPFDFSFLHTSGPVRGFAITLALGIFVSLFTGLFISRTIMRAFIR